MFNRNPLDENSGVQINLEEASCGERRGEKREDVKGDEILLEHLAEVKFGGLA